jgi:hypothetical protein
MAFLCDQCVEKFDETASRFRIISLTAPFLSYANPQITRAEPTSSSLSRLGPIDSQSNPAESTGFKFHTSRVAAITTNSETRMIFQ